MPDKIKNVREFFDQESVHYYTDRYKGQDCEQMSYVTRKRIVLEYLQGAKGNVLDAGVGPGINTGDLLAMGLVPYSIDLSEEMLRVAKSSIGSSGRCFWLNSEIERLPLHDRSFDYVLAIGVIAYADDAVRAILEFARVLKPGGFLIVQCSNPLAPAMNADRIKNEILYRLGIRRRAIRFHLNAYSFARFKRKLEQSGFIIDRKSSYDFRVPFAEKLFPLTAVRLMDKLQHMLANSRVFDWLGEGYVIKALRRD